VKPLIQVSMYRSACTGQNVEMSLSVYGYGLLNRSLAARVVLPGLYIYPLAFEMTGSSVSLLIRCSRWQH
jgi:hypothetical protein